MANSLKTLFLFIALLLFALELSVSSAPHPKAGTFGVMALDIGQGARGVGLGEAFTAGYGTSDMSYWNVAGLSLGQMTQLSFTHTEWLLGTRIENLSFIYPTEKYGAIGFHANLINYGTIARTVEDFDGTYFREEGTFTGRDIVAGIDYAYNIWGLGFGLGINYLRSAYDDITANAGFVNFGVLYRTPVQDLCVGISGRNIGTRVKYINAEGMLPMNFKTGLSYALLDRRIVLYTDFKYPVYQYPSMHAGIEVSPVEHLILRAGYKYFVGKGAPAVWYEGISAGIGINLNRDMGSQVGYVSFDYAFVPYQDIGFAHRISLEIGYEDDKEEKEIENQLKGFK